jgi:hypothetical protein
MRILALTVSLRAQGVRQEIWRLYHNRTADGYELHDHVRPQNSRALAHHLHLICSHLAPSFTHSQVADMGADMRKSKFCLSPAGHGWGIRIVHAMATGCVPLIIQDGVHQPFDDVLPYHEFSLRLPQADIARLDDILRSVTPVELAALQRGVRRFHKAFIWEDGNDQKGNDGNDDQKGNEGSEGKGSGYGGEAYHWVVRSLQRRLQNVLAGF